MDHTEAVRSYYGALDAHDYDRLSALLSADFVQRRPDRTFEGREAFVSFMRDGRPRTDTTHEIDSIYERVDGEGDAVELAARGRLLADGGEELLPFVDVFRFEDGRIAELSTYAR
ncbi:nuclear transport factor 2 family protein [Halegenticoccus soli]|uniref:nuclear transport factor 2 family protein n=1 Tax=Halegenticoccus soli TaxID=1985678 RepID=UPI000C6DE6C3|nr:nuclear transport factor 2 family protein [Halegenticoccus soli]